MDRLSTLGQDGKWPDSEIDYKAGCSAQRANWPASSHWARIIALAAAYHGGWGLAPTSYTQNATLRAQVGAAMDWWFDRDFTNDSCLDRGGSTACPCRMPGLWNTNWFSNTIGVPQAVGKACILLSQPPSLTPTQFSNCSHITARSYAVFHRNFKPGYLAGANTMDIANIGIVSALIGAINATLVEEAYAYIHAEVQIKIGAMKDGILSDGSFAQHGGLLYNGNYGKDFINDVLELEIEAGGTRFAATGTSKAAFESLVDASRWMIYENTGTGVLHWDFVRLPRRFISFPVLDHQTTGSLQIDLNEVQALASLWDSPTLQAAYDGLKGSSGTANVGNLIGNRVFWNADYIVHRGESYVTTLKTYSSRTHNAECINSENPSGFHLADGTVYTYMKGDEYEDIAAAWDWNMIPGTTVDYDATPLQCGTENVVGLEAFVGGVSNGSVGAGVMRYTNPITRSFSFQKAWFFFPKDIQHISILILNSNSDAPVFSILDQRKRRGTVYIDSIPYFESLSSIEGNFTRPHSLFHDHTGYVFSPEVPILSISAGFRTGSWASLGISAQPNETVDLFAAWLPHDPDDLSHPFSYTVFPARDGPTQFFEEAFANPINTFSETVDITAAQDMRHGIVIIVFWNDEGGAVDVPASWNSTMRLRLESDSALVLMLDKSSWSVTVSDPTQLLIEATITVEVKDEDPLLEWSTILDVQFPKNNGMAGSSVKTTLLQ
ncbi:polysaccharide lyase family 8 protein [Hysterangium stoloniferum]|nr:polysaccharide lyase family 8 protein [Hysterangium stoloniferum]